MDLSLIQPVSFKTGSLNSSICVFKNGISFSNYSMLYKYGKVMCNLIIKMNIAFALVGYEIIITNSMVHVSLAIYHLTYICPVLME